MLTLDPIRDTVFIGHANPADNQFTTWLALQLANHGYKVWCDLVQLVGGEDFWKDIEEALRTRTAKHIYVLSSTSNKASGCLNELAVSTSVAKKHHLGDFVIPVRIDAISYDDMNIEMKRLNAIDASSGWANALARLLEKLEKDQVPQTTGQHDAVNAFWREQFDGASSVSAKPDELVSNYFPIRELPDTVYLHASSRADKINPAVLPYPAFRHQGHLISFAPKDHLQNIPLYIVSTRAISTTDYLRGATGDRPIDPVDASRHVTRLLRIAWERTLRGTLRERGFSNKRLAYYHEAASERGKELPFVDISGKQTTRAVVGYRTVMDVKRFWHFAISARPLLRPSPVYCVQPHLLFSDDGKTIWTDDKRLQRARHGQTKDWWNNDWRDRVLAMMKALSADGVIQLPVHRRAAVAVEGAPLRFISPVSYREPVERVDLGEFEEDDDDTDDAS